MAGISVLKHGLGQAGGPDSTGIRLLSVLGAMALLSLAAIPASASPSDGSEEAKDRFLVVLRDSTSPQRVAEEHRQRHGAEISHTYQHALKGYAAKLPAQAVDAIARDPRVAFVEPDQTVEITSQVVPTGIERIFAPANSTIDVDATDDVRVDVDVAIIDTGIDGDHPDLNVASTTDCTVSGTVDLCLEGAGTDDNGHGTHVAGTTAALDNDQGVVGVAPGARLHGVKVLGATGAGLLSWVIAGVDWVSARSESIEVANLSLGCQCASSSLNKALASSVEQGVVYVVAAGNSDKDASGFSPANHPDVITVSALADFDGAPGGAAPASCRTDVDDTLADFSNWGSEIEVAAPGVCVLSTWPLGGYRTLSGTSMASPHVAGAAGILTSGANDPRNASEVAAVRDLILGSGNINWFDDSGDASQEPLLDVGDSSLFSANSSVRTLGSSPSTSPDNQAPVADFTYSCSDLTCSFDASGSSDPDGTISSYAWNFGDGTTATGPTVEKTYGSPNTYTVQLSLVDDDGATSTALKDVTVTDEGSTSAISLSASGARAAGTTTVKLDWFGTDRAGTVIVYRNGAAIATSADDGSYTEMIDDASGTLTYKVCEEGTTRCSNEAKLF